MSTSNKRARRSQPKKMVNVALPGVEVSRTTRGDKWAIIKLQGQQRLFPNSIDGCSYRKGRRIRDDHKKSGDLCTHSLGCFYSSHTLVTELRFDKNNGIRVKLKVSTDEPMYLEVLATLARCLVRRATIAAHQSHSS